MAKRKLSTTESKSKKPKIEDNDFCEFLSAHEIDSLMENEWRKFCIKEFPIIERYWRNALRNKKW